MAKTKEQKGMIVASRLKKWRDALLSGEYVQGAGQLRTLAGRENPKTEEIYDEDRYCCLGVLTDLYVQETGDTTVWGGDNLLLPPRVAAWLGLCELRKDEDGSEEIDLSKLDSEDRRGDEDDILDPKVLATDVHDLQKTFSLSQVNDGTSDVRPYTFEEIAELILQLE